MPDELIRSREAAEILGCDIRTVHRWADEGRLPIAMKVPGYRGAYLFRRADVEALLDDDPNGELAAAPV